jgi:hypothetical protein
MLFRLLAAFFHPTYTHTHTTAIDTRHQYTELALISITTSVTVDATNGTICYTRLERGFDHESNRDVTQFAARWICHHHHFPVIAKTVCIRPYLVHTNFFFFSSEVLRGYKNVNGGLLGLWRNVVPNPEDGGDMLRRNVENYQQEVNKINVKG